MENNKFITWLLIGMLAAFVYFGRQIEKKMDLAWEDITIVGDALKIDLDEIKEKLDELESEIQAIRQ